MCVLVCVCVGSGEMTGREEAGVEIKNRQMPVLVNSGQSAH